MSQLLRFALRGLFAVQFLSVALAQTIVVDGQTEDASQQNVAPAAATVSDATFEEESMQLTEAVLTNLTDLSLTNISLLYFGDEGTPMKSTRAQNDQCRVFPGDDDWPRKMTWRVLDIVTGGALVKTVPIAAPCYDNFGVYDKAQCTRITNQFNNSYLHESDPTSVMSPVYQGLTCLPTDDSSDNCTLGGYPSYAINATNVADIQIAVNFARRANLRLVIKNTGHDFNGRSLGAGALSIWMHGFQGIKFYDKYKAGGYQGPVMKVGAGVYGRQLYEAAEKYNVTAVGGEGETVGYAGGYLAGGGHSPMTPLHGIAADSVLSINVVMADGRLVTADERHHKDLFWALRGGGGSTFGVAVSYVVKVYPKIKTSVMSFSFSTGKDISYDAFWEGVRAYIEEIPSFNAAGNYEYWNIIPGETLTFNMVPWFAPGMSLGELQKLTSSLFAKWEKLGIHVEPEQSEHDSFYGGWNAGFPQETVGGTVTKTSGRLFPVQNWKDEAKFNATFDALKGLSDKGGQIIAFGISSGPGPYPDNAVNPAWRDAAMWAISVITWPDGSSQEYMAKQSRQLTQDWMQPWRDAAPDSGAYASEADVTEPNFKQSFYGSTYDRLLDIKDRVDPTGLFYALQAVGSDRWYVTGQLEGFPTQDGRLCPVS